MGFIFFTEPVYCQHKGKGSTMSNESKSNPIWVGLILIVLGVIFLTDSFHIIRIGHLLTRWWPLILIAVGISKLSGHDRNGGIFLILLGVLFQLSALHIIHWHQIWRLWPVILIIIGIGMLLKRSSNSAGDTTDFTTSSDDRLEINSIFSSTERQISSQQFAGGEINAIFGNIKLDLRSAKVVPEGCHLHTDAVFGSIEIYVSPSISVNFKGSQFLGRVDNLATVSGSGPAITISGDAVFGNIRISN